MSSKIDVRVIVTDHFSTLRDHATGKRSGFDIFLFIGLPFLLAAALIARRVLLTTGAATVLITSLSIFTGLLLNLLLLIHSLIEKAEGVSKKTESELLRQLYANISYNILIAIITLSVLIVAAVFSTSCWLQLTASGISYFLVVNFLFTILMILKRVYALLDQDSHRMQ
jgi:hypothetical protein